MIIGILIAVISFVALCIGMAIRLTASDTQLLYRYYGTATGGNKERLKTRLRVFTDKHKLGSFLEVNECCNKMKKKGKTLIVWGLVGLISGISYGLYHFLR